MTTAAMLLLAVLSAAPASVKETIVAPDGKSFTVTTVKSKEGTPPDPHLVRLVLMLEAISLNDKTVNDKVFCAGGTIATLTCLNAEIKLVQERLGTTKVEEAYNIAEAYGKSRSCWSGSKKDKMKAMQDWAKLKKQIGTINFKDPACRGEKIKRVEYRQKGYAPAIGFMQDMSGKIFAVGGR